MPPACDQMNRILGKRAASPLNVTPMMARVVSVPYSMLPGPRPARTRDSGSSWPRSDGRGRRRRRRLSSSITGLYVGLPSQCRRSS